MKEMFLSAFMVYIAVCLLGCRSDTYVNHVPHEFLPRGMYPELLPPEKAHNVTLKLNGKPPNYISAKDINEITNIVSRMPGLLHYEIRVIGESIAYPGLYDIQLPPVVLYMERYPSWRVFKVGSVFYH